MKMNRKNISRYILAGFFIIAGINHFINPQFYLALIPPIFKYIEMINILAGIGEVALGIGLMINKTRKIAAWGIVLLLIAFIHSHVYFIQIGGCIGDGLCVPLWVGWVRLVLIHPLLIMWAYTNRG